MTSEKPLMRRGEVIDWLRTFGIKPFATRRLFELRIINAVRLRPDGETYYSRAQIQRDVLDKTNPAEVPASNGATKEH